MDWIRIYSNAMPGQMACSVQCAGNYLPLFVDTAKLKQWGVVVGSGGMSQHSTRWEGSRQKVGLQQSEPGTRRLLGLRGLELEKNPPQMGVPERAWSGCA